MEKTGKRRFCTPNTRLNGKNTVWLRRYTCFSPLSLLILLLTAFSATAQIISDPNQPPIDSSLLVQQPPDSLTASDTLPLRYSFANSPEIHHFEADTTLRSEFRQYDPARKKVIDYAHLGNLGSSARPLWFQPESRIGFATGYRAFDLYAVNPNDLQFYRHSRTYSHAYFSRGPSQRDAMSWLKLSRTFSGGANFSLLYKTTNNLGLYRFQRTKHNSLAAGVWVPVGSRYEAFLVYANNTFQQQDNGGITSPDFFATEFYSGMISVPTLLTGDNSKTKYTRQNLQLNQYFTFGRSSGAIFRAEHTANYRSEFWKYSDINTPTANQDIEAAFYGNMLTDTRGLRNYSGARRLDNTFLINTLQSKADTSSGSRFGVGIRHSLIWAATEPLADSLVNNLYLTGQLVFAPNKRLALHATGDLGILPGLGYRATGDLTLNLGKAGQLEGFLLSQLHPSDLVQGQLYSTGRQVWKYDWKNPFETSFGATYRLPLVGFSATARNHTVANYIYFDQDAQPQQLSGALNVVQLLFREDFHWRLLHTENTVALQQISNTNVLRLPTWFSKNSLYIEGKIFKQKMLASVGADFRMNSEFRPDAYQPFTGQFHLQDTFTQAPYPWLDGFMAVKIQAFRFYFRYENLSSLWLSPTQNLYLTANHPQNRAAFRLGISWRFLDSNQRTVANTTGSSTGRSGPPPGTGSRF